MNTDYETLLLKKLKVPKTSFLEKRLRFTFSLLDRIVSEPVSRPFASIFKWLRGLGAKRHYNLSFIDNFKDYFTLIDNKNFVIFPPNEGIFCLTHDVDRKEGLDFIPEIRAIEKKYGFCSSFNFLTGNRYKIEKSLLSDLKKDNFEINLHGAKHDSALAFRRKEEIYKYVEEGISQLGINVKGFRSPSLSVSENLLSVLDGLGFLYDSSIPAFYPSKKAVNFPFPYRYPGLNIWEIPLVLSDDVIFRDFGLDDEEAFNFCKEIIVQLKKIGAVNVFNGHPGILKYHMKFYRNLLEYLKSNIRVILIHDAVKK